MLRSLRGRNYVLFFFGQGLSLIGTWMQTMAQGSLVWKLTHDKMTLGLVGFSAQIFGFLLAPLAGVLSDRWNRHRLLLATQFLSMVQSGILAYLTLTGQVQVWQIMVLAAMLGLVNAVDIPTRQSFVVQMVRHRSDLPNAIALNSFIFNGARMIGPVVAGLVIPLFAAGVEVFSAAAIASGHAATAPAGGGAFRGEGACFVINSVSYLAILGALLAMKLVPWRPAPQAHHVLHSLREGFRYTFGFPPIRTILLMLGWVSLMSMPYSVLLPAFASGLQHGAHEVPLLSGWAHGIMLRFENTYGLLVSSAGLGAILGALFLASRKSVLGLGKLICVGATLLGIALVCFALCKSVLPAMAMLVVVGFGAMVQMASSNTILQTIVDDDKRGRVMSFYTISFLGTAPFGALMAGSIAERFGTSAALIFSGVACLVAAGVFTSRLGALRRSVRPIYVKIGILSESADIPRAAVREDIEGESSSNDRESAQAE